MKRRRFATKRERDLLLILQDWRCALCQQVLEGVFEIDHIQPFSEKGATDLCNLQALCVACHSDKSRTRVSRKSSMRSRSMIDT